MWRMVKNLTGCARSAVMLDGETSTYVEIIYSMYIYYIYIYILQGVAQGCTLSHNLFKVPIDDVIEVVEEAKQGVTVGEDTVSALTFADNFVGISETPEGLQKRIGKALKFTRKLRVTANAKNVRSSRM